MSHGDRMSLLVADAVGACIVAVCLTAVAWLTVFRTDHTGAEVAQLTSAVHKASVDLANVRRAQEEQESLLAESRKRLGDSGQLPDHTPIEEYFQALAELTARHDLRVLRQSPIDPREYPGLLEQRYSLELVGSTLDLVRFFRSIEHTEFWADISFLEIANHTNAPMHDPRDRVAQLTVSLFSALPVAPSTPSGSG